MPCGRMVTLGSFRSVPLVTPPSFLPIVTPATICQFFEKRLFAVNSTPLYCVSRNGSLSRMLFCALDSDDARLYAVTTMGFGLLTVPPGPFGTVNWNGVYDVAVGTAVLRWPNWSRFVR